MSLPKEHIKPLTAIRAIGVFWVIIGHYHAWIYTIEYVPFREIMRYPMLAVDTFFFLSGFVITYIYAEKFKDFSSAKSNYLSFFAYRFARIYPLHLLTLLAALLMIVVGIYASGNPLADSKILRNNHAESFFYNLFLIHGTGIMKGASWNYPSWSISVEFILYLFFPLIIPILSRFKFWLWNILIIGGVCIYYYSTIKDMNFLFVPTVWANDIVRGLANFSIGICLYNLYSSKFLTKFAWDFMLLAICIAMLAMMLMRIPMNVVILIMPIFIYSLANLKSFMQVIFCNKILVYLGEISYGLYMLHIPYGMFVMYFFYDNGPVGIEFWGWRFILMLGGLIALSSLSYHYFETLCRKYVKNRINKNNE